MRLTLENNYGKVVLGGGEKDGFNVLYVQGLGLISKNYTTVECIGVSGQETINVHEKSRVITIGGDVSARGNKNVEKALAVLSDDVVLTVVSGKKKRKINTKIKDFQIYNKNGGYFAFVLQMEADYPYFTDTEATEENLYERKKLITGNFDLPCVFTARMVGKTIENKGNCKIYPQIIICDVSNNGKIVEDKSIQLINESTGKSIKFNYGTLPGEILTFDFETRSAQSNKCGDITGFLELENYLSDFYLKQGDNKLDIINNTDREVSAFCRYFNNYNECL